MKHINPFRQCQKYDVPLRQCPSFIFSVMGMFIVVSSIVIYLVGIRFISNPLIVALLVMIVALVQVILSYFINKSFENLLEVNRMKRDFINIVSHQMRTPLSSLRWAVEFITSGKLDHIEEKYGSYIDIIKEDVEVMGRLIEEFLTVSRIEDKSLLFKKEKFSLSKMIDSLISEFKPFCEARNVKLEVEKEDIPEIISDSQKVRVVIENLIDNAIKYSKEKGMIKIFIKKQGRNVYVGVKDTGVGIPREEQKYIFQKFYRSRNVNELQTKGSGLGLYITKSIVESLGGKIGFSSEENKGSLFWFTIPIVNKNI